MRWKCALGGTVIGLCSLAGRPSGAAEAELDRFLDEWTRRMEDLRALEVRFRQEKRLKVLRRPLVSSGTILISLPDRLLRCTVRDGEGKVETEVLAAEGVVRIVYPAFRRIEVYPTGTAAAPPVSFPGLWGDVAALKRDYRMELERAADEDRLTLVPRNPDSPARELRLVLERYVVKRFEQTDRSGDSVQLTIEEWRKNPPLEPGDLRPLFPPDFEEVRPLEKQPLDRPPLDRPPPEKPPLEKPPLERAVPGPFTLSWERNMLSIRRPDLPGGKVDLWYLEAFCRSGSTRRKWDQTVIPHRTEKTGEAPDGRSITLRTVVEGGLEVLHEIRAGLDEVDFRVEAVNRGPAFVDASWVQPCLRVGGFTGRTQETYVERCFIYLDGRPVFLDRARRTEEAIYRGGQVYVPAGIDREDVNPRPLSPDAPSHPIIGCLSADGRSILATAWEPCQELFQGVIVCIHADFRLGGLEPGQTRRARGKVYLVENDLQKLLDRFRSDFESKPR